LILAVAFVMRMASYHKADEDSERDIGHRDAERGYFDVAETEKFSVALESTTQGAAMLAVAQWSDAEYASKYGQKQATGRLINGLGLFAISFVLQVLLIALLLFFSTQRMQDPYQFEETTVMAESLRKAQESNTTLPETDRVLRLCLQDHSVPYSQSVVVFLWLCKISPDIIFNLWTIVLLASLPKFDGSSLQFADGNIHIVRLPRGAKWMLILFVKIPMLLVQLALAKTGMTFLMYCSALGILIMKALALSYVCTVPSVVFAGLASKALASEVGKAKLTGTIMKTAFWDAWLSGIIKIALHVAVAVWYCRILHAGLTAFRWECFFYKYKFVFPTCHCGAELFGVHIAN